MISPLNENIDEETQIELNIETLKDLMQDIINNEMAIERIRCAANDNSKTQLDHLTYAFTDSLKNNQEYLTYEDV